jgi:hypothetical protein
VRCPSRDDKSGAISPSVRGSFAQFKLCFHGTTLQHNRRILLVCRISVDHFSTHYSKGEKTRTGIRLQHAIHAARQALVLQSAYGLALVRALYLHVRGAGGPLVSGHRTRALRPSIFWDHHNHGERVVVRRRGRLAASNQCGRCRPAQASLAAAVGLPAQQNHASAPESCARLRCRGGHGIARAAASRFHEINRCGYVG